MLPATPGCWFLRPVLACWRDMTCAKHSKVQHPFGRARWSSLMLILTIMQKSSKNCIRCYVFPLISAKSIRTTWPKGGGYQLLGVQVLPLNRPRTCTGWFNVGDLPWLGASGIFNDRGSKTIFFLDLTFVCKCPTLVDTLSIFAIHFHAFSAVRGTVHQAAQTLRAGLAVALHP